MPAQKKAPNTINLLPKTGLETTPHGRLLKWLLGSFRVIVIMVEIVVIGGFATRFYFDIKNADAIDEIKTNAAIINSLSSVESEFRIIQSKLSAYKALSSTDNHASPIFSSIIERLPETINLKILKSSQGKLEIQAITVSEGSISQFMANLGTIESISNPVITQVSARPDDARFEFTVRADIPSVKIVEDSTQ